MLQLDLFGDHVVIQPKAAPANPTTHPQPTITRRRMPPTLDLFDFGRATAQSAKNALMGLDPRRALELAAACRRQRSPNQSVKAIGRCATLMLRILTGKNPVMALEAFSALQPALADQVGEDNAAHTARQIAAKAGDAFHRTDPSCALTFYAEGHRWEQACDVSKRIANLCGMDLVRAAQANLRNGGLPQGWLLVCRVAWEAPGQLKGLSRADKRLQDIWTAFEQKDHDIELDDDRFPAWAICHAPDLALASFAYPQDRKLGMMCTVMASLVRHPGAENPDRALMMALEPNLLKAFLRAHVEPKNRGYR